MKMIEFRRQLLEAAPCGSRSLDCDLYRLKDGHVVAVITPFDPDGERFPVFVYPAPVELVTGLFPRIKFAEGEYFPIHTLEKD